MSALRELSAIAAGLQRITATGADLMARQQSSTTKPAGNYAAINGLKMYYEVHEADPRYADRSPLVLLHGALSTIDTDFGGVLARLAGTRRIITIEQQGHGHTADLAGRPLTYEAMSADTAALLTHLGIKRADIFGYSMGGGIALHVAKHHPDLVRSVIFAGAASFDPSGLYPELREAQKTLSVEALKGSPFEKAYASVAPRPEEWPTLVEKMKTLDLAWRGTPADDLRAITIPTLLIVGDADIVRPEHTVEMFRLLGGGVAGDLHGLPRAQLAILPGTTHIGVAQRVEWLVSMVTQFIDGPHAAQQL